MAAELSHWFKPGQSGNPAGRPKGSRNKFSEDFLADFHAAWQEHGVEALQKMAANKPSEFVKAAVQILPKQVEVHDPAGDLDAELTAQLIEVVTRRIAELQGAIGSDSRTIEGRVGTDVLPALPQAGSVP